MCHINTIFFNYMLAQYNIFNSYKLNILFTRYTINTINMVYTYFNMLNRLISFIYT